MTKKDYILIANDIKRELANSKTLDGQNAISKLALVLTLSFRVDNSKFDDTKFLKACGIIKQFAFCA